MRDARSANPVTVQYATANGSAVAGSDYTAVPTTALTFTPGQTSQTLTVRVLGDTMVEPNETFLVNLSTPSGATLFDAKGVGTILNDDGLSLTIMATGDRATGRLLQGCGGRRR